MLDIKRIRENLDDIKKAMDRRGEKEFDLDAVIALDDERRELLKEENKRKIYIITQKGKERLELEKERMQKQIILFMKKDYEDEI